MESVWIAVDGDPCVRSVPATDRGFQLGDGVFEVMRGYPAPFAVEEHVARLAAGAARLGFALPLSQAALAAEIRAGARSAGYASSLIRLTMSRGSSVGLRGRVSSPRRVLLVSPLSIDSDARRAREEKGARAALIRDFPRDPRISGIKHGSFLPSVLATNEAMLAAADEALLVDDAGSIREGASSNVFAVVEGVLCTPPLSAQILAGVTRAHVLDLARSVAIPIAERSLGADDVNRASEIFVTSSIREVLGVRELVASPIAPVARAPSPRVLGAETGPMTRRLAALLQSRIAAFAT